MKVKLVIASATLACIPASVGFAQDRPTPTLRLSGAQQPGTPKPTPKPSAPKTMPLGQTGQAETQGKPPVTAKDLVEQGKQFYRTSKLPQALKKFTDALKLEADNDEALGLAAITAFRLGNYEQSRELFGRRLALPAQKDSVKAYCHYWTALAHWREAHERLAMRGEVTDGKVVYKVSEKDADDISADVRQGLEHAANAVKIKPDYAAAHNVTNLLHAEAAILAGVSDERRAENERRAALDALRQAIKFFKPATPARETADFGAPTIRVGEFARTKDEIGKVDDPMMKEIEGGQPVTQFAASLPALRPAKQADNPNDPSASGVTSEGGAYSVGRGRGALNAAYAGGKVKVEVLVSTAGNVVFARVVDGRADLNGPALAAAKRWKFSPAKFEGQPVQVNGVISFTLKPGAAKPAAPKPTPTPAAKKG